MQTRTRFESVVLLEASGYAGVDGFHLEDNARAGLGRGFEFSVCSIASQQIAVMFGQQFPPTMRANLASRKPDWLDAVVHAELASNADSKWAVIDAEIIAPADAEPTRCAFATACVAFGVGAFKVVPERYLVRLGQRSVQVTMDFNDDTESWYGEVMTEAAP
jgi:hypothetical protein